MQPATTAVEPPVPSVCKDSGNRTCIAVFRGRRYVHYIACGDYHLRTMLEPVFWRTYQPFNYDLPTAAKKYLDHAQLFSPTDSALTALRNLSEGVVDMSKPEVMTTASGTPVWPPTAQAKAAMEKAEAKKAEKSAKTKEKEVSKNATAKPAAKGAAKPAAKGAEKPAKAQVKAKAEKPAKGESSREAYAGKTIKALVKTVEEAGLRPGSLRAKRLELVLKCKTTDEAMAKTFKVDGTEYGIDGSNLRGMVDRGHIALS